MALPPAAEMNPSEPGAWMARSGAGAAAGMEKGRLNHARGRRAWRHRIGRGAGRRVAEVVLR